jgi:hypothetical protein
MGSDRRFLWCRRYRYGMLFGVKNAFEGHKEFIKKMGYLVAAEKITTGD